MVIQLPDDVWIHTSQFLDPNTLAALADAFENDALRAVAKEAKYRDICVGELIENGSDKDLRYLVRSIVMKPWPVVLPCTASVRSGPFGRFRQRVIQALHRDHFTTQAQLTTHRLLLSILERVVQQVKQFDGVTRYSITWDNHDTYHPVFNSFLLPIMETLSDRLICLEIIRVPLEFLCDDMAGVRLPKLEHLVIHFETGAHDTQTINERVDSLLVFINNLKDTLQSLSICSTSSSKFLKFHHLFQGLGHFRHLRGVSIRIPFDGGHLEPVALFEKFIERHRSSLERLELVTNPCAAGVTCQPWILDIVKQIDHQPFPCLRELTLALRPLKADLSDVYNLLAANVQTLDTIKLTDRLLDIGEIQAILQSLRESRLKRLCVMVQCLTPGLLNLLAIHTPHLDSLGLVFDEIVPNEATRGPQRSAITCTPYCKLPLMEPIRSQFFDTLASCPAIQQWRLQHMALRGKAANISAEYWVGNLESKLVECIPALRTVNEYPA